MGRAALLLAVPLGLSACGSEDFDTRFEREKRAIEQRGAAIDRTVQEQMAAQRQAEQAAREMEGSEPLP